MSVFVFEAGWMCHSVVLLTLVRKLTPEGWTNLVQTSTHWWNGKEAGDKRANVILSLCIISHVLSRETIRQQAGSKFNSDTLATLNFFWKCSWRRRWGVKPPIGQLDLEWIDNSKAEILIPVLNVCSSLSQTFQLHFNNFSKDKESNKDDNLVSEYSVRQSVSSDMLLLNGACVEDLLRPYRNELLSLLSAIVCGEESSFMSVSFPFVNIVISQKVNFVSIFLH